MCINKWLFFAVVQSFSVIAGAVDVRGTVNTYVKGIGDVNSGAITITTSGAYRGADTAINAGDTLLLLQVQGADIDFSNTDTYGDGVGTGAVLNQTPTSLHGTDGYSGGLLFQTAGTFEYANVVSVSGQQITLATALEHSYFDSGETNWQVVVVPDYSTAGATLVGDVTAEAWDGDTGGVIAFNATGGVIDFNGFTVDAAEVGFRGGVEADITSTTDDISAVVAIESDAGRKGEGVAGTPKLVYDGSVIIDEGNSTIAGGDFGRGAPGNAGGGAGPHNSGGGGGSNAGRGGTGAQGYVLGTPVHFGGYGGHPILHGANFGGGGGSGEANNDTLAHGGVGGGVIMLRANSGVGAGMLDARGGAGLGEGGPQPQGDGAGGGGAGGSVFVYFETTPSLPGLNIDVTGGNGGDADFAHGGGGGGGGGNIVIRADNLSVETNGGQPGLNFGENGVSSEPGGDGRLHSGEFAFVPSKTDFGDAPKSYGTISGMRGARHFVADYNFDGIIGPNETLRLGNIVDGEGSGNPSAGADSDDNSNLDDEDGLASAPPLNGSASSYTISSSQLWVSNTQSAAATLHAWIDFDLNGLFDSDEYTSLTVPSGLDNQNPGSDLFWSSVPGLSTLEAGATTYLRLRLTRDSRINAGAATGAAHGGEVEDYALTLGPDVDLAPSILSITRFNPQQSLTNANELVFNVAFSEAVQNVDIGDFSASGPGAAGAAISAVSGSGSSYSVTLDVADNGAGTVNLDIAATTGIQDSSGNDLSSTEVTGVDESYELDNAGPSVAIENVPATSDDPFSVSFVFSEDVLGFDVNDISVSNGSLSEFTPISGNTYTALVTPDIAGTVSIDIASGAANDALGNPNTAAQASSIYQPIDSVRPSVGIINVPLVTNGPFNASFEFSEGVSGFEPADITLGNCTLSDFIAIDDNTYTAVITPLVAGPVTIDVMEDVANNGSGVGNTAAPQAVVEFDNIAPSAPPSVSIIEDADNNGAITFDELSGDIDVRVSLPADAQEGDTVMINYGAESLSQLVTAAGLGNGSQDFAVSGLSDGDTLIVVAFVIDRASNSSPASAPDMAIIQLRQDGDNDGLPDDLENDLGTDPNNPDSDGDGIPDGTEVGDENNPADSDNDGNIDALDPDDDNDGIPTRDEDLGTDDNNPATEASDEDSDGTPNYLDRDSDGDGIPDAIEAPNLPPFAGNDSDDDGIDDAFDADSTGGSDSNGNGIDDTAEAIDSDGDGRPNYLDLDSDNDGIPDATEEPSAGTDSDGDGIDDRFDADLTGDEDNDGDGVDDNIELTHSDKDGLADYVDLDSDNDGRFDVIEGGGSDEDNNALFDGDDPNLIPPDSDSDGVPDYRDTDSDNDGVTDIAEGDNGPLDQDGDGQVDDASDNDQDGLADNIDGDDNLFGHAEPDPDAPSVSSITRLAPQESLTNANELVFSVSFSEAVQNVDVADFALNGAGTLGATISSVSGSGDSSGDSYEVTVDVADDAQGSVNLDLSTTSGIQDNDGNDLASIVVRGADESYELDNAGPSVAIQNVPANSDAPFVVTFQFSEEVAGFEASDVSLINASLSEFTAVNGSTYTALITPTLLGTATISIADGVASDALGNPNSAAIASSEFDPIDPTKPDNPARPSVEIINVPLVTNAPFSATFEFSENVSGFEATDITLDNATLSDFTALDSNTYSATITPIAAGDVTIDIGENVAVDNSDSGNTAAAQVVVNYDPAAPSAPSVTITEDLDNNGEITFDELDGDIDVQVGLPAGAREGDSITITYGNDSQSQIISAGDLANGSQDFFVSGLSDGDTLTVVAAITVNNVSLAGAPDTALINLSRDGDNDGLPDSVEDDLGTDPDNPDSDGDGIPDDEEVGDENSPADSDNDGIIDALDPDDDNDGIPTRDEDLGEDDDNPATDASDEDSDGTPNYLDGDSDGDGIPDAVEAPNLPPFAGSDSDNDGIDDAFDVDETGGSDSNGNGVDDGTEAIDSDGDGRPNYLDLDSDNDGIPDATEEPSEGSDSDGDGIDDRFDVDQTGGEDSDGDGVDDNIELSHSDKDGLADYVDLDSDNDGRFDVIEGGGSDEDNNALFDGDDPNLIPPDSDSDGVPDYRDTDSDNDGVTDIAEGDDGVLDQDGDGQVDDASDNDQDGLADNIDGDDNVFGHADDKDGDGVLNSDDLDDDNDGILDSIELANRAEPIGEDSNGNGIDDAWDVALTNGSDRNNDGIDDLLFGDTDGDGLIDSFDRDADSDGISDSIEGGIPGVVDNDRDGEIDDFNDANGDGVDDRVDLSAEAVNTDNTGLPDFQEWDADDDGINDLLESGSPGNFDQDGDSILDNLTDLDRDGIADIVDGDVNGVEFGRIPPLPDTDNDGAANYVDADSDGDGFGDSMENGDYDNDGVQDYLQNDGELRTAVKGNGAGSSDMLMLAGLMLLGLYKLLGQLGVYRRCRLAAMLGALLLPFAFNSEAANSCAYKTDGEFKGCWYLGAGLGVSHLDPEGEVNGWQTSDDSSRALGAFIGRRIHPHWLVELSYYDGGEAGLENPNPAVQQEIPDANVSYKIPALMAGYYLFDKEYGWNLYGKFGLSAITTKANDARIAEEKQSEAQLALGAGLEYRFKESPWKAALVFDSYDRDAKVLSLRVARYFGGNKKAKREPAAPVAVAAIGDGDNDGVIDADDQCPNTVANVKVDELGCEIFDGSIRGVNFELNSADLTAQARQILDEVAGILGRFPDIRVEVQAHTDAMGSEDYNLQLSKKRAQSVLNYLQSKGVDMTRMQAKGYGEEWPLESNETIEGRAANRRVQFLRLDVIEE